MSKFPPQGRRVGMSSLSDEKVEEELSKINPNVKVNSISSTTTIASVKIQSQHVIMCLTGEQDIAADSAEPIAQSECGHHPQDLQDQRPGMGTTLELYLEKALVYH